MSSSGPVLGLPAPSSSNPIAPKSGSLKRERSIKSASLPGDDWAKRTWKARCGVTIWCREGAERGSIVVTVLVSCGCAPQCRLICCTFCACRRLARVRAARVLLSLYRVLHAHCFEARAYSDRGKDREGGKITEDNLVLLVKKGILPPRHMSELQPQLHLRKEAPKERREGGGWHDALLCRILGQFDLHASSVGQKSHTKSIQSRVRPRTRGR